MTDPQAQAKAEQAAQTAAVLAAIYQAAKVDVLRRLRELGKILLPTTWRDRIERRMRERTLAVIKAVAPELDESRVAGKVDAYAKWFADTWDDVTKQALAEIDLSTLDLDGAVGEVMDRIIAAAQIHADSLSHDMGNFAVLEQATLEGKKTKTWRNGDFDAPFRHNGLEGVTVGIGEDFPNGLSYPGAPSPPEERVNCKCFLTVEG